MGSVGGWWVWEVGGDSTHITPCAFPHPTNTQHALPFAWLRACSARLSSTLYPSARNSCTISNLMVAWLARCPAWAAGTCGGQQWEASRRLLESVAGLCVQSVEPRSMALTQTQAQALHCDCHLQ